jgi:hypothetical protein
MLEKIQDSFKPAEENTNENTISTFENNIESDTAIENSIDLEEVDNEFTEENMSIDYDALSMETLVEELQNLSETNDFVKENSKVNAIKKSFLHQYNQLLAEQKQVFENENADENAFFEFNFPLKASFDTLYSDFRNKKNSQQKAIQNNQSANLAERLEIVESLKKLVANTENIKESLVQFNELRERWKAAGAIPKDKYNHVWNNYHFHVENFYDYLHLDREARDLDFKYNLEQKQKIVARAAELAAEEDTNKSFGELQDLHRIWKEELGPVSKEFREVVWNEFSEHTKKIHDKRELYFQNLRKQETENLEIKNKIIAQIQELSAQKFDNHSLWKRQTDQIEAYRELFFSIGKVPIDANQPTWDAFKLAVRAFNESKNSFYKESKKEQNQNMNLKLALIAKAQELQDSTDYNTVTPLMKQIQEEWKQIGHAPRKFSDKLWTDFRAACNHYFDQLKQSREAENADGLAIYEQKKAYLENFKDFQLQGNHKEDLEAIKLHIKNWKDLGRVPNEKRHVEGKFNKILDVLFEKLSLSKKETDMMQFTNRIESFADNNEGRKLENEKIFISKKIDEIQNEIFQLENNIQFFSNSKSNKKENPLIVEVRKNIEIQKEALTSWKDKLQKLHTVVNNTNEITD